MLGKWRIDNMSRTSCLVIEDNILELLEEVETQLGKGIICCKCKNPCEKNNRCALAMKNLLTDIDIFKKAYIMNNPEEVSEEEETSNLSSASLEISVAPKDKLSLND